MRIWMASSTTSPVELRASRNARSSWQKNSSVKEPASHHKTTAGHQISRSLPRRPGLKLKPSLASCFKTAFSKEAILSCASATMSDTSGGTMQSIEKYVTAIENGDENLLKEV